MNLHVKSITFMVVQAVMVVTGGTETDQSK